jgi:diguanylate cyclase (GGDEF)-like protein/PAS domain S-box-containing protein
MLATCQALGVILVDPLSMAAQPDHTLCSVLGYAPGEANGTPVDTLIAPEHRTLLRQALTHADSAGAFGAEIIYISKQGTPLPLWTTIAGAPGAGCQRALYVTPSPRTNTCVTHLLKDLSAGVVLTDASLQIVAINQAFTRITGFAEADIVGHTPKVLSSGRHKTPFYRAMWRSIKRDGCWHGEVWNRRRNGDVYPERLSISAIRDEHDRVLNYVGLFYDISDEIMEREKLDEQANRDHLTELPNRHAFLSHLERSIRAARRSGRRLAMLFVDVDNFKDINDSYGHTAGDLVLQVVARRLHSSIRQSDYLARWGGDEMVILLNDGVTDAGVAAVTQKIAAAVSAPLQAADTVFYLTVSIGIALYPDHAGTAAELIDKADQAMYRVKWSGRNGMALAEREDQ